MGPCAGGAVYSPAITDFIFMVKETSHMFITGPDVIKTVTGEEVGFEELGGAMSHNTKSGVAHFASEDEDACLRGLPLPDQLPAPEQPARRPPRVAADRRPASAMDPELDHVVPGQPEQALRHARRRSGWSSTTASSSRSTSTTPRTSSAASRAWTASRSASSATSRRSWPACSTSTPRRRRRASSAPATRSTSRSSPSSTCPASCPGTAQEWGGIIRHGAKLLYAYTEATVPEGHGHHAQGLRRRLRRDGLQAPAAPTSTSPGRPPRSR